MRRDTAFGLLALVGSTSAVACAATPAPDSFESEQPSAGSRGRKSSKSDDDSSEGTPLPASTESVPDREMPGSDEPPPPAPPVQAADTVWTGTLAKTGNAKFGGSPYCQYQVHFENVKAKVVIGADGKIKSASVTGQAVEEALNGCPNAPIAPNAHDYTLLTEATGTSFTVNGGGPTAKPRAKMDADVSAAGETGTLALKLQRSDQEPVLTWTLNTKVSLTKEETN